MTSIPTPAQVVQQREAAQSRELERARVKVVRNRKRARGGKLAQRMDEETALALSKLAHPDAPDSRTGAPGRD